VVFVQELSRNLHLPATCSGRRDRGAPEGFGPPHGHVGASIVLRGLGGLRLVLASDRQALGPPVELHADLAFNLPHPERLIQNQPEQTDGEQDPDDDRFGNRPANGETSTGRRAKLPCLAL